MSWFRKSSDTTEHGYVEERLSAYLDGELSQKERMVVDRHLAACRSCQWNLTTLKQTVQWTRELPAVPVPRVFTIPASAAPAPRPRRNRGFVPLLQGATALVALLLFFVMAGDFLLSGSMLPAAAPEPQMLGLDAPAESRAVVEMEAAAEEVPSAAEVRVTVVVEAEKKAPPAERVAAEPTQPPATPVVETVQVEKAVAATESAAGGEADATEAEAPAAEIQVTAVKASVAGVRATPTRPLTTTYFFTFTTPGPRPTRFMSAARTVPTAKVVLATDAPRFAPTRRPGASPTLASMTIPTASAVVVPPTAAPPALTPTPTALLPLAPTATALPVTTVLPAATLRPTARPQAAPPTALPRPTALPQTAPPTVIVQAQKLERRDAVEGGSEPAALRQAPVVPWLRLVELTLATAFVLLAAITLVAMVRRRQAG